MIAFARREMGGAFTWDEVAQYRDRWKGTLIVKGIMHPQDAEKAVSLGVDGMFVSNHGGRQIEALPAPIDVLPAIVKQVGKRATVMYDSGIRSGTDVVRAYALGAAAAFAGKAFLWGLGALGEEGASHVIDILMEETQAAIGQLGALTPEEARSVVIRHNSAWGFEGLRARLATPMMTGAWRRWRQIRSSPFGTTPNARSVMPASRGSAAGLFRRRGPV